MNGVTIGANDNTCGCCVSGGLLSMGCKVSGAELGLSVRQSREGLPLRRLDEDDVLQARGSLEID